MSQLARAECFFTKLIYLRINTSPSGRSPFQKSRLGTKLPPLLAAGTGERILNKWSEFIESIRTSGVIEPIVITRDLAIVSGHQRVRACKELGITTIPARIKDYANEDEILKDLLETNVRQRGNIDGSALKLGRIIAELERIYGVYNGNHMENVVSPMAKSETKSQDELFEMLGVSKDTYHRAKNLLELIPELQDSLEEGYVSALLSVRSWE